MRYNRAERLIQLALEMQAARGGLTITDIMERFDVSRRTAIRMRDAVIRAFPSATEVPTDERSKRWRISPGTAQSFAEITSDDLASIEIAAAAMHNANLEVQAEELRGIAAKIRSLVESKLLNQIDPDLEALMEAEGLAHRAGPRLHIPQATVDALRTAIKSCRQVSFDYVSRTGKTVSRRKVAPLGFLYGHRHYLVGLPDNHNTPKFFSLPSIKKLKIEKEGFIRSPEFNLRSFVSNSFGVFEEPPVNVVWRFSAEAAPLARAFVFHHSQKMEEDGEGRLIVRFYAGGLLEMAWHLVMWGAHVEVLEPSELKRMMPFEKIQWPALP